MTTLPSADDVLDFWFGPLSADGQAPSEKSARWWKKSAEFDQEVKQRFEALRAAIMRGECEDWLATPKGALAYVIVLDQLSRNMFRGTAAAFEADPRAVAAATKALEAGHDAALAFSQRNFLRMPFMHAEDRAAQARCVELFTAMAEEAPDALREQAAGNVKYAKAHQTIVDRFGRFPHRNEMLGRPSTAEEIEFLKQPGSSF